MTNTADHTIGLDYFPGNYRWSAALRMAISSAKGGGAEPGEVDVV